MAPELPDALVAKLAGQITQDPGLPVPGPTVSAWQEPSHALANTQSAVLLQQVDYAIIGSGITGCSVAKTLLERSASSQKTVSVFEARSLTTGATSRNGGFLTSHVPIYFASFAAAFGDDAAQKIAKFGNLNLQQVREMAEAEGLTEESEIREAAVVSMFEDQAKFDAAVQSIRMYEEAVPEAKGHHQIMDGKTAQEVRQTPPPIQSTAWFWATYIVRLLLRRKK